MRKLDQFQGPGHFPAYRSKAASSSDRSSFSRSSSVACSRPQSCRRSSGTPKPSFHAVKITALGPVTHAPRSQPIPLLASAKRRPSRNSASKWCESTLTGDPYEYRRTVIADDSNALTTAAVHSESSGSPRTPLPRIRHLGRSELLSSRLKTAVNGFDRRALESVMITPFPLGSPESCSPNAFAAEPRYSPSNDATTLPGQRCIVGQGQGSSPVASGEALGDLLRVFGPQLP